MSEDKYVTGKLEYGTLEEATKEQLTNFLRQANENRARGSATLYLKLAKKYGDEFWSFLREHSYAEALRRGEFYYKKMVENGDDRFLPDPRIIRRYLRSGGGVIGIAHHFKEVMEGDPKTGQFKLSYQIDRCPMEQYWRKMGVSSELRQKLCWAQGNSSDTAIMEYFGIRIYEDMGLPKQKPTCSFVFHLKDKEEHENWGKQLPSELQKYYRPWPYLK